MLCEDLVKAWRRLGEGFAKAVRRLCGRRRLCEGFAKALRRLCEGDGFARRARAPLQKALRKTKSPSKCFLCVPPNAESQSLPFTASQESCNAGARLVKDSRRSEPRPYVFPGHTPRRLLAGGVVVEYLACGCAGAPPRSRELHGLRCLLALVSCMASGALPPAASRV